MNSDPQRKDFLLPPQNRYVYMHNSITKFQSRLYAILYRQLQCGTLKYVFLARPLRKLSLIYASIDRSVMLQQFPIQMIMLCTQAAFEWSSDIASDISQQTMPQTHQRSNQLKLQENKPKFLTVEVISSKTKASVTIDGTTVSRIFF